MNFYDWFFLQVDRTPEGMFSFAHLASVSVALAIFVCAAYLLGRKFKNDPQAQTITLLTSGFAIVMVFIIKMVYLLWGTPHFWESLIGNAPLYLCDMQIFIIPIAALTRGRVRDCCMDFIAIWGLLMGFLGTYFAGNIYGGNTAICFFAIISLLNHAISAFAAMFVMMCKLSKMEKRNIPFTIGILVVFMTAALIIDYVDDHNFMFFFHGDGTPFVLFDMLVHEIKPLYQIEIYILQCGYMVGFYYLYYLAQKLISRAKAKSVDKDLALKRIVTLNWTSLILFGVAMLIMIIGWIIAIPNGTVYGIIMKIGATVIALASLGLLLIRIFKYQLKQQI